MLARALPTPSAPFKTGWILAAPSKVWPPISKGTPQKADLAIMIPRTEVAPVSLALYILSAVPFAILLPVGLVSQAHEPNIFPEAPCVAIRKKFDAGGKVTILASQVMWVSR